MRPIALIAAALAAAIFLAVPARADDRSEAAVACVAEAVYFEARGTGAQSQAAVAHVVLNRAESDEFPDTPCAVVNDRCQFSYQCDGKPERLTETKARAEAYRTAEAVLAGKTQDPTDGALFFHAGRASQGWFKTRPRTAAIGGHVFYR
jgi:spore germination cell wall hydrolase CwlJ-like protein